MENKHPIDELFAKGLSGYEASPGGDAWPGIEAVAARREKRKRFILWRWAAVAAALLLAFYSGYYFKDQDTPVTQPAPAVHEYPIDENSSTSTPLNKNTDSPSSYEDQSSPGILTNTNQDPNIAESETSDRPGKDNRESQSIAAKESTDNIAPLAFTGDSIPSENQQVATVILSLKNFEMATVPENPTSTFPQGIMMTPAHKEPYARYDQLNGIYESPEKGESLSPLSIRLLAGLSFPFTESTINTTNQLVRESLAKSSPEQGYSGGIELGYRLSSKVEIRAGLLFNQWKQTTSDIRLLVSQTSSGTSTNVDLQAKGYTSSGNLNFDGFSDPSNQGQFETSGIGSSSAFNYALLPALTEEYQFIDIPISFAWFFLEKHKWSLSARGGLNSRFLTNSKATLTYANGEKEKYEEIHLNTYSVQLIAGAGINYNLTSRLQIGLQPTLLYGISPINKHQQVDTYFHQLLIYSGLTYRF